MFRYLVGILIFLILGCFWGVPDAKSESIPGGIILDFPVGARAMGMGCSFSAVSSDVSSLFWNPAGLSRIKCLELGTSYFEGVADTYFCWAGCAKPTRYGNFGLSLSFLNGGKALLYEEGKTSSLINTQKDYVFSVGYASNLDIISGLKTMKNISIGLNLKLLRSTLIEEYSATALCIDLGFLLKLQKVKNLSIGAVLQNLGSNLKYDKETSSLPLNLRLGIAYTYDINPDNFLMFSADFIKSKRNGLRLHTGCEYWFRDMYALRAGYMFGYDSMNFTFGAGIHYMGYLFDYALLPIKGLESLHRVSCSIKFY